MLQCWKTLCTRYVNNWCKNNVACGLLVDSVTGAVGLIRKNAISLCRGLEDVEHLIYGMSNFIPINKILHKLFDCISFIKCPQLFLMQTFLYFVCYQVLLMNLAIIQTLHCKFPVMSLTGRFFLSYSSVLVV